MLVLRNPDAPVKDPHKPTFPWNFLADPDGPDAELVAIWMALHLQAKAYRGFLETGRGVLLGPFLSDEYDVFITSDKAILRRAKDQVVGIAVMYLSARSRVFSEMVPDESQRESIRGAIDRYDPETQCVVLLRHDNRFLFVRMIGAPEGHSDRLGPRAAYYEEFLLTSAISGLPN